MYDLSYLYRTVTNLPARSWTVEEYDGDTEVTASTSSSTSEENCENRVEEEVTDTETTPMENSNKTGKKKSKTRAQIEREELADKIINFANKEDHPVDLELSALSNKIKLHYLVKLNVIN